MKTVALVPYCPWPADTGGKAEMLKHLEVLQSLGECAVVSASTKPVGAYWTPEARREMERRGFQVRLREERVPRRNPAQLAGIAYAGICKALRLEKAFGHANPYHRYAFPRQWWHESTVGADLAVVFYSFWVRLPTACPKVAVLLDLWSDYTWEHHSLRESRELKGADLTVVISQDELQRLRGRGLTRLMWSPPCVAAQTMPDSTEVGLVGSNSPLNREGMEWLTRGLAASPEFRIKVYGTLAQSANGPGFDPCGRYEDTMQPFRECGVILMPTAQGMGVQIKTIEALAAGRAIVARRGAIRGIPRERGAWIEVETADEMLRLAQELRQNPARRACVSDGARAYYRRHLESGRILKELADAYAALGCGPGHDGSGGPRRQ